MSTGGEPDRDAWPTTLAKPQSNSAASYIQQLHESPGQLQAFIAAPPLPAGSTLDHFRATLYEALCANPDLPDAIALPALESFHAESFHAAHSPPLLQALDPSRRSVDTIPAVLSLQRPAWLQVLLSSRGLKAGARYAPSGGPLRRLKATTLLHAVVLAIALAPDAQQRQALERSFTQLLLAGADPCAVDSCGLAALEWMVRDALRGQVTGTLLRSVKHVSSLVVRQLWRHGSPQGGGMLYATIPAEEALPLLQQPLQQLLAAAARAARPSSTLSWRARTDVMAIALARAGSWQELLQLLPVAEHSIMFSLVQHAMSDVTVAQSIAAGSPMPWSQAFVSMHQGKQVMTPQQRQRLLAHYCSHPDHLGLYCMLDALFIDVIAEAEAAALLPRGLRAVLQLVRHSGSQRSTADQLELMLQVTVGVLSDCLALLRKGMGPNSSDGAIWQAGKQVVSQWVQQGLVEDLKQAAGLGSQQAPLIMAQLAETDAAARTSAPCALVDCLLENPQVLESFLEAAGAMADALDGPGPLPLTAMSAGSVWALMKAMKLVPAGPKLQQLLAGPLGQQLRRLGRHQGDARLQSSPWAAETYGAAVDGAAVLMQLPQAAAGNRTLPGPADPGSGVAAVSSAGTAQAGRDQMLRQQVGQVLSKEGRRQGRLYSHSCDQCGKTGAELQQQGGKLLRCTGCEQAWYCGAECQKEAWKAGHRAECRAAQKAAAAGAAGAGRSKRAGGGSKGAGSSKSAGAGSSKGAGSSRGAGS